MTKLAWDVFGEKNVEHGLDHGVLYPTAGPGVPWNGLTAVTDKSTGGSPEEFYFDGVKYATVPQSEEFSASIEAFTYPEEFIECDGVATDGNGLYFDKQQRKQFGLSYRTMRGNDVDQNVGYKIHLVYNAFATPNDRQYSTNSGQTAPMTFGWNLTTTPIKIPGYRPTAHIVIDSTKMNEDLLYYIEIILYGSDSTEPRLPELAEITELVANFDPRIIIEDLITGLAPLIPGRGDLTGTDEDGVYKALPDTELEETRIEGLYDLEE